MISLLWALLLWCRDVRDLGRSLATQYQDTHDPYGLFHRPDQDPRP